MNASSANLVQIAEKLIFGSDIEREFKNCFPDVSKLSVVSFKYCYINAICNCPDALWVEINLTTKTSNSQESH